MPPKENANTARKGTISGINNKKQGHNNSQMKAAPMAKANSFGQAKTIASGKKNFSRGAPGHQSTPSMKNSSPTAC